MEVGLAVLQLSGSAARTHAAACAALRVGLNAVCCRRWAVNADARFDTRRAAELQEVLESVNSLI
jgi:hypothetical protein